MFKKSDKNTQGDLFSGIPSILGVKSKYRGLEKNLTWAICQCLWVNLVRIMHFSEQTCQRTVQKTKNDALLPYFGIISVFKGAYNRKLSRQLSILPMLFFIILLINF